MYQEWFKKFEEVKKEEKCLCKKAYEEIDRYYLMSVNEAKGTLQIFKNRRKWVLRYVVYRNTNKPLSNVSEGG